MKFLVAKRTKGFLSLKKSFLPSKVCHIRKRGGGGGAKWIEFMGVRRGCQNQRIGGERGKGEEGTMEGREEIGREKKGKLVPTPVKGRVSGGELAFYSRISPSDRCSKGEGK